MGNYLKFEDLSSPISAFNFGNQALKNLSNVVIGSNTVGSYLFDIENCNFTPSILGTNKSSVKLTGAYTADYFNTIDFYYSSAISEPSGRVGYQFTGGGSFFTVSTSNSYGSGTTHLNFSSGFFATENVNGIKLAESLLFTTNNIGSIGTSSVAVANIYSVNALNVTSDNDEKKDINKNIPLGLDFVKLVANTAIANYSWKDTIIPEKKAINFKKVEKINNETNEKFIDYELENILLEPEKIEKHSRTRFGFLGVELYNAIIASGLDTKKCAFLSVYDEEQIYNDEKNAITSKIKENKKKKPFEVKLTKEGRPKGKITIQPTEMLPILFKAISEQSQQIEELQAQVKLLLEK